MDGACRTDSTDRSCTEGEEERHFLRKYDWSEAFALPGCYVPHIDSQLPTSRENLSVSIGCPETSSTCYRSKLCNIPEDRRSHWHRGGNLKWGMMGVHRTDVVSTRTRWAVVSTVMNLRVSNDVGNFLTSSEIINFSRRNQGRYIQVLATVHREPVLHLWPLLPTVIIICWACSVWC
jgi:hypothetical protein